MANTVETTPAANARSTLAPPERLSVMDDDYDTGYSRVTGAGRDTRLTVWGDLLGGS